MKKVYYQDVVPKKNNKYQWSEIVGLRLPFEYDGHVGELEILDVSKENTNNSNPTILAKSNFGIVEKTTISSLKLGYIQKFVLPKCDPFNGFEKGQIIKNDRANIQLLEKKTTHYEDRVEHGFTYRCLDCGFVGYKIMQQISKGSGCKYANCRNKNLKESMVH